eukprot:793120-Pleurochrysis_carterae.AAC.1
MPADVRLLALTLIAAAVLRTTVATADTGSQLQLSEASVTTQLQPVPSQASEFGEVAVNSGGPGAEVEANLDIQLEGSVERSAEALGNLDDPRTLSQLLQWGIAHTDLDALHAKAEAVRAQQKSQTGDSAKGSGVGMSAGDEEESTIDGVLSADGNIGEYVEEGGVNVRWVDDAEFAQLPTPLDAAARMVRRRKSVAEEKHVPLTQSELKHLADVLMPNQVELMRAALDAAMAETANEEEREEGLNALQELVEDIDNARDFMTIGGFKQVE